MRSAIIVSRSVRSTWFRGKRCRGRPKRSTTSVDRLVRAVGHDPWRPHRCWALAPPTQQKMKILRNKELKFNSASTIFVPATKIKGPRLLLKSPPASVSGYICAHGTVASGLSQQRKHDIFKRARLTTHCHVTRVTTAPYAPVNGWPQSAGGPTKGMGRRHGCRVRVHRLQRKKDRHRGHAGCQRVRNAVPRMPQCSNLFRIVVRPTTPELQDPWPSPCQDRLLQHIA